MSPLAEVLRCLKRAVEVAYSLMAVVVVGLAILLICWPIAICYYFGQREPPRRNSHAWR